MCNPQWGPKMEEEFRATLSEQGYVHEILADFGSQETGVFNKDKLDKAMKFKNYAYSELTYSQRKRVEEDNISVEMLIPPQDMNVGVYKPTVFRTMGIDWDKYGASSSILILDYVPKYNKFQVVRRIEVPKAEYSFDKAVNMIIDLNRVYNPTWIYADRGSGGNSQQKNRGPCHFSILNNKYVDLRRLAVTSSKRTARELADKIGGGLTASTEVTTAQSA